MMTSKESTHQDENTADYLIIRYNREDEIMAIQGIQFREAGLTAIIKELELIRDSMISIYVEEE